MLYTEPEFVEKGVPVFKDHADPNLFWYLPADIAIARKNNGKGDPIFSFIKFRNPSGQGGGFLSFQVDLRLPERTREAIEAKIATLGLSSNPRLVQVPFTDGTVQCVTLDSGAPNNASPTPNPNTPVTPPPNKSDNNPFGAGGDSSNTGSPFSGGDGGNSGNPFGGGGETPSLRSTKPALMALGDTPDPSGLSVRLVNQVLGAAKPSLQGDNNAIFTLVLTPDGAEVVLAALKGGQALLGVIYQLNYTAMQPALNVKVSAKMDQVYRFLGASASAQYKFLRADLSAALERLRADKVIKIERTDTQGTDASGKELDAAMKMFTDMIVKDFFTPMLIPGNPRTPMIPNTPYNPNMPYNYNSTFPSSNLSNPYGFGGSGFGNGIGLDPLGNANALNNPFSGGNTNPFGGGGSTTNPFGGGSTTNPFGGGGSTGGNSGNPFSV